MDDKEHIKKVLTRLGIDSRMQNRIDNNINTNIGGESFYPEYIEEVKYEESSYINMYDKLYGKPVYNVDDVDDDGYKADDEYKVDDRTSQTDMLDMIEKKLEQMKMSTM